MCDCSKLRFSQYNGHAEQEEKDKQFNSLTEAAGELMSLGFEDIYSDSRDTIACNLNR